MDIGFVESIMFQIASNGPEIDTDLNNKYKKEDNRKDHQIFAEYLKQQE